MGFMDFLKKTFDKGGIKVKVTLPKDFRWDDGTFPATVILTGHKSEPRTVTSLGFTLDDVSEQQGSSEPGDRSTENGQRFRISWGRDGAIDLAPQQIVTLEVPVVLHDESEQAATKAAFDAALQSTKVGKKFGLGSVVSFHPLTNPREIRTFVVTVRAPVDGANRTATASRKIRQSGTITSFRMGTRL